MILAACLWLAPQSLLAADITGTVTNKTTNRPAAGDDVILLKLSEGMQEVARTKSDAHGAFTLKVDDPATPHLVRVSHRNVNYHRPAPPGTTSVEVEVFDAAESVPAVKQTLDILRVEADATNLRITELVSVTNDSKPPVTQMSGRNMEIVLPRGATIEQALAAGPGGMPVTSSPVPLEGTDNHYAFVFPIRPGETRFQFSYTMPYDGSATITPTVLRPTESFAVSLPKSMQLEPAAGSRLESKGEDAGLNVYVAQNVTPGQAVGFKVSGTGSVPQENAGDQSAAQNGESSNRPGGGLGAPINTPDPLSKYKWWIISVLAVAMVGGAGYALSGSRTTSTPVGMQAVLKDELFRLETERAEGRITPEEYQQVKQALDVLMRRALAGKGQR